MKEIYAPGSDDMEAARLSADHEEPPLSLKENAERLPLYEELAVVLAKMRDKPAIALHNMRALQISQSEIDAEQMETVKLLADADTTELKLPKTIPQHRKNDEVAPRVREQRDTERMERNVMDALKRLGPRRR